MKLVALCALVTAATVASGLWMIAFRPGGASVAFFALTLAGGALGANATGAFLANHQADRRELEARRTPLQEKD